MDFNYDQRLHEARTLAAQGAEIEKLLRFFRENGATPIDSIKMLRDVKGLSLADAKQTLHYSITWADLRGESERLHEALETSLEGLARDPGSGITSAGEK